MLSQVRPGVRDFPNFRDGKFGKKLFRDIENESRKSLENFVSRKFGFPKFRDRDREILNIPNRENRQANGEDPGEASARASSLPDDEPNFPSLLVAFPSREKQSRARRNLRQASPRRLAGGWPHGACARGAGSGLGHGGGWVRACACGARSRLSHGGGWVRACAGAGRRVALGAGAARGEVLWAVSLGSGAGRRGC